MTHRMPAALRHLSTALLVAAFGLAACGGGTVAASADSAANAAPQAPAPLFDRDGRPLLSPREFVPADTAARTRAGLYATAAQLEWELLTASPVTVLIDVDQLGSPEAAVLLAAQVQWMRDNRGFAFFVRARHVPDAARVVDRLSDSGFAPVFLVV
jgi:hypothetical protein